MSIYEGLQSIVERLEPHASALSDRGSWAMTEILIETETREQFDAVIEDFPELTELPTTQLYSNAPMVDMAVGLVEGMSLRLTTIHPTVPRACPFCDEKHDCTHTDGMVA